MPRYFFHFSDGERQFSDDTGQDLSGLGAARAHATNQVRELKAAMCDPAIQDLSGWSMSVADGRGRIVFVIGFDLKPRAITPEPPRRSSPGTAPAPSLVPGSGHGRADAAKAPAAGAGATAKD